MAKTATDFNVIKLFLIFYGKYKYKTFVVLSIVLHTLIRYNILIQNPDYSRSNSYSFLITRRGSLLLTSSCVINQ